MSSMSQAREAVMKRGFPRLPSAPTASSPATQASMRGNTSSGTAAEARLERAMQARGLNDYVTNASDLPGSPDFVFPTQKLAIFVHGCYWHRCPYCQPHFPETHVDYWAAKFQRNRYRDARNRADLCAMGWRPIVVWECTLRKSPQRVVARINHHLEAAIG